MQGESFSHQHIQYVQARLQAEDDRLAAEHSTYREEALARAARLGEQFPKIAAALRKHAERVCRDLEVTRSADQQRLSIDDLADKQERDYWEFLTILAQAVPDLPIVEMHDEGAALTRFRE